jgi:PTS system nitrogen regulatory IIA component
VANDDFDVAELAAYLHMMPAQVTKLAERGKLPARKVTGNWRFSRAEVTQWLEMRIGASDDDELAEVETNLDRADHNGHVPMHEVLPLDAIAIPLAAKTRSRVISNLCQLVANTGLLWDADKMAEAVTAREAMQSTALDIGVALLHPRRPQASILAQAVVGLGVTQGGIPFGGSGHLTDVFFLICATNDYEHLRILARLSRMLTDPQWLADLRATSNAQEARCLILDRDEQLGE